PPQRAANVVIEPSRLRIVGSIAEVPLAHERRPIAGGMKHFSQRWLIPWKIGDSDRWNQLAIVRRILSCLAPYGHVQSRVVRSGEQAGSARRAYGRGVSVGKTNGATGQLVDRRSFQQIGAVATEV